MTHTIKTRGVTGLNPALGKGLTTGLSPYGFLTYKMLTDVIKKLNWLNYCTEVDLLLLSNKIPDRNYPSATPGSTKVTAAFAGIHE